MFWCLGLIPIERSGASLEVPNGHMWRLRLRPPTRELTFTGLEKARHHVTYAEHAFPAVTAFKPTLGRHACTADQNRPAPHMAGSGPGLNRLGLKAMMGFKFFKTIFNIEFY